MVVFIPKPGGSSFCGPRDFRLINLISFLLKIMERVVDRFLRDEILALRPLHHNNMHTRLGNIWKRPFASS